MSEEYPPCPKCGGHNFKVIKLPCPFLIFWILTPVLALNELVFGQRMPKVQLNCLDCNEPPPKRGYVFCPNCQTLNHCRSWSKETGNWLGRVCPSCGTRISSIWNLTSLVILAVTSPIWYLPYRFYFRDRVPKRPLPYTGVPRTRWINMGASWGLFMWLARSVFPSLHAAAGGSVDWSRILIGIPVWAACGALFGFWMQYSMSGRGSGKRQEPQI
jgi:Zn finger protein HypA/HybF involved in hydrogenase expression